MDVQRTNRCGDQWLVFEVFLVDSEGLGGVDKNQSYDMKLFALTVLLSSFLIFNQVGVIDEAAIASLSVVTQLAKNVQVARGADGRDALASHMP